MRRILFTTIFVAAFLVGCAREAQGNFPVTWRQDEDEIVLYVYLSREASTELISILAEPVTFDEMSQFFVQKSGGNIPFMEGAMASAALVAKQEELRAEMEFRQTIEGNSIEIIGFKENPVRIMKGSIDFPDAPKYLADFEPQKHPEIVNAMIDMMSGNGLVVMIGGG